MNHSRKRLSSTSSVDDKGRRVNSQNMMDEVSNEYGALCVVFGQTWC